VQNRDRIVESRRVSKRVFESYVSRETLPFDQTEDANLAKMPVVFHVKHSLFLVEPSAGPLTLISIEFLCILHFSL
jgi:hypothetical protein